MSGTNTEGRFWAKVDRSGDCWVWTAYVDQRDGYGRFKFEGAARLAHRVSYQIAHGSIPEGLEVDHQVTCPKTCVRPEHLRLATHKQNLENVAGANRYNRSSGIRGVTWDKETDKWIVQVIHNYRRHYGGRHPSLEEAEAAAVALRNKLFTHNAVDKGVFA